MSEKKKVLIIEDDPDIVEAMKLVLESENYAVAWAQDPDEGYSMAKSKMPDIILLDVMFGPSGTTGGFDCAQRIRRDKSISAIPILMITAVNEKFPGFGFSPSADGEYLPVDGFIEKPAQPAELLRKVGELLSLGRSRWAGEYSR
jgi:DNA-binding response OmpR family regulator